MQYSLSVPHIRITMALGVLAILLFALPLQAQERALRGDVEIQNTPPTQSTDSDNWLSNETQRANYNNTRSNRSTVRGSGDLDGDGYGDVMRSREIDALDADDDGDSIPRAATNVCDGVTCPDGSCAVTASECSVFEGRARGLDQKFQQVATSVSPVRARDADSDGDGLSDGTERASYNNSRSNRSTVRNPDDQIDWRQLRGPRSGLQTAANNVGEESPARERLIEKLEAVQTTVPTVIAQQGRLINDDENPSRAQQARIKINTRELRTLSEEERTELRELRESLASSTPEYRSLRLAERAIANERIEEVEQDEEGTALSYRARLNLFGFIPLEHTVRAEKRADSDETRINYPWYRIFASTPDTDRIRSFFTEE